MRDEEFKNLEHAQKEKEKCMLEIKREEAKEKAGVLWEKNERNRRTKGC